MDAFQKAHSPLVSDHGPDWSSDYVDQAMNVFGANNKESFNSFSNYETEKGEVAKPDQPIPTHSSFLTTCSPQSRYMVP